MDSLKPFMIIRIIIHGVSSIACPWLISMQLRMPQRTIGTKMVTVLGVSDFIFHFSSFLFYLTIDPKLKPQEDTLNLFHEFLIHCLYLSVIFSLFWASVMAFITFKAFSLDNKWNLELTSKKHFLYMILPPLLLSIT